MKHSNRHVIFIQTICAYSKKEFLSIYLSIRINYDNYYIIIKYYYKLNILQMYKKTERNIVK